MVVPTLYTIGAAFMVALGVGVVLLLFRMSYKKSIEEIFPSFILFGEGKDEDM